MTNTKPISLGETLAASQSTLIIGKLHSTDKFSLWLTKLNHIIIKPNGVRISRKKNDNCNLGGTAEKFKTIDVTLI
jgi:hypothetical protein